MLIQREHVAITPVNTARVQMEGAGTSVFVTRDSLGATVILVGTHWTLL